MREISGCQGQLQPCVSTHSIWVVVSVLLLGSAVDGGAKTYLETALGSLKNLPADSRLREDLEAVIASQANAYRQSKGVRALQASPLLRDAARAQAVDMMLNGYVGHRASSGHEFDSRMRVFLGSPMWLPQMAENAARDTQKGEADAAKAGVCFNNGSTAGRTARHCSTEATSLFQPA